MTINFKFRVLQPFEELRLIKAHHVICMTVQKETVDLRLSPLKRSIKTYETLILDWQNLTTLYKEVR